MHVSDALKTQETDTCPQTSANPPATCIETEMPDTCVLTNERAPGPPGRNKKPIHVYHRTARTHRADQKLRQKQVGSQIVAVCCMCLCLV